MGIIQPFGAAANDKTQLTATGVGAVAGTLTSVVEYGNALLHKSVITLTAESFTMTDESGTVLYGGTKIYDFPEGLLCTLGVVIDGSITGTSVLATFDGDVAVGTVTATTGATLTSTEADILQSVALTQAVAKVANADATSVATILTESGARWIDGTSTAKDAYLNFVIDDDAANATGTATFTGTVTIVWMIIGDN